MNNYFKYTLVVVYLFVTLISCGDDEKSDVYSNYDFSKLPSCMQSSIQEYGAMKIFIFSRDSSPTYYMIESECCDRFNVVLDCNCKYICAPSGGITGNGDGLCSPEIVDYSSSSQVWP